MAYYLAKFFLWLLGWKITSDFPKDKIKKCMFIVAPHTSYYDFIIGKLAFYFLKVETKIFIKKDLFKFPLGPILRALGGVPVDKSKVRNLISQAVEMYNKYDTFYLTITPEGTRKYNANWKHGFYHIAQEAHVPLYFCFIDFKHKRGGIGPELKMTGDIKKDFEVINEYYKKIGARHPAKFNLTPKPHEQQY